MSLYLEHITQRFGQTLALNDIDLEIRTQAITVFYIFISKMIPLCFCINSARKLKKLPSAKLNGQRLNVMITLPERRLNDYENLE